LLRVLSLFDIVAVFVVYSDVYSVDLLS
jgi:hypothetical protein